MAVHDPHSKITLFESGIKNYTMAAMPENEIFCHPFSSAYAVPGLGGTGAYPSCHRQSILRTSHRANTERQKTIHTNGQLRITDKPHNCMSLHCERKCPERISHTERPRPNDCGCGHSANLHAALIAC